MPIFRRFVEDLLPLVPTIWRRKADNLFNITFNVFDQAMDSVAEALSEYIEAWPIDTAPGWLLDSHWGPYHNLQRNGLSDADCRVFIHAKRLLNKSWGSGDQALEIFQMLLPTATLTFSYAPPKSWVVNITGVDMADTLLALAFMEKKPSPIGGGFSVAGDNGVAVVVDKNAFNYSSVYGVIGVDYVVTGFFSSVYGPSGGLEAGWAHVAKI